MSLNSDYLPIPAQLCIQGMVLFFCLSSVSLATDFYVCDCATGASSGCSAGNDTNPGTEALPWQSYDKARTEFANLNPGDQILFCRTGAWDISGAGTRWVNGSCQAANPCVVSAYVPVWGNENSARPILNRLDTQHGISLADGGHAEHEEGYVFSSLDLRGTSGTSNGFFLQNDIDDVTIRDTSISGFAIGVHLAGSNPCSADPNCDGYNQRIVLENSTILHNESQGWLGASNGSQILNSYFEGNGSLEVYDHNIYLSGSQGIPANGMRVAGNRLYRSDLDASGLCRGVSLVVHGDHDNLVIENNEVWEDVGFAAPGCWGIAVDPGYSEAESFIGITIRGNLVRNVGNVGIGVASCEQCIIENNVIVQENAFDMRAIAAPDRNRAANDHPMSGVIIRNNSIYLGANSGGTGIRLNGEGSGHILVSNAIHYAGNSTNFNCLDADLPAANYIDIDYNLCFHPSTASAEWAHGLGTLSQWQTASGFDGHSSTTDPGFADPASFDLSPVNPFAAMVDNGHPALSSTIAINEQLRDAQPDIGAYEWNGDFIFSDGFE